MTADSPVAACPLCHTASAGLSAQAFAAGALWRCTTCGQTWTAERLAAVAAYEAWVAARASNAAVQS
jgi:predicted Zn finger-like uncharacterized protein